jgi:photosystem II stability/assembly factor-like uncharacterized protein
MERYPVFWLFSFFMFFITCNQPMKTESSHSKESIYKIPIQLFAFRRQDTIWLTTKYNTLLRSDDRGEHWVTDEIKSYGHFQAMTFINKSIGWAVNDKGQVWGTKNSGNTWELLTTLNYDKAPFVGPLEDIQFIDESNGWILDPFAFWNTSDGGLTWKKNTISIKTAQNKELVHQLFPLTKDILWMRAEKQEIYYSEDGGKIWEKRGIERSNADLNQLFFVSNKMGWACSGPNGGIYKTEDSGKTWQKQNVSIVQPTLYSIYFIDENEGWAAGRSSVDGKGLSSNTQGLLLHTGDGGNTWERIELQEKDIYYQSVHFSTPEHGWLISNEKVYRTNDKGKSWEKVFDISNK